MSKKVLQSGIKKEKIEVSIKTHLVEHEDGRLQLVVERPDSINEELYNEYCKFADGILADAIAKVNKEEKDKTEFLKRLKEDLERVSNKIGAAYDEIRKPSISIPLLESIANHIVFLTDIHKNIVSEIKKVEAIHGDK